MQRTFICYTCKQQPTQFTILHCDHIICSRCLDTNMSTLNDISIVQCPCGTKTFCNQQSMRMSLRTPEMAQVKEQLSKINKINDDSNTKISNFFILQQQQQQQEQQSGLSSLLREGSNNNNRNSFNCCSSNNNNSNMNKINIKNKTNNKCTQNLCYLMMNPSGNGYSRLILKTQSVDADDESVGFIKDENNCRMLFGDCKNNKSSNNNSKCMIAVKSAHTIIPMTESEKASLNPSPRNQQQHSNNHIRQHHNKLKKQTISRLYSSPVENPNNSSCSSTQKQPSLSQQLEKQLKFLSIQYQREIQHCEKAFNKIIRKINSQFEMLLRDLHQHYLPKQNIKMENNIDDKYEDIIAMPQVIKKKYDKTVGKRLGALNEKLISCIIKPSTGVLQKHPSCGSNITNFNSNYYQQRDTRQSFQLTKDIENSQIANNIVNPNKKSRKNSSISINKKSKSKECRLYLAINPKKKNDKIINYIDVIKKQPIQNLKKNSVKNSFKLNNSISKLRIY